MSDSQPETFEAESRHRKPGPQRRLEYFLGDRFPQIDDEDYVHLRATAADPEPDALAAEAREVIDGSRQPENATVAGAARQLLMADLHWRMKRQQAEEFSQVQEKEE
ncbi:MAG: hypothetical protein JSW26_00020 [Desulfobacterales bacterium]|nr:MAG: hypothetical protein JSW26_00020 [Desulfobacterales bacterium]